MNKSMEFMIINRWNLRFRFQTISEEFRVSILKVFFLRGFFPWNPWKIYSRAEYLASTPPVVTDNCGWVITTDTTLSMKTLISLQIFWQKFCRNVCWVVLHQVYHFRPNLSIWLVAMATEMLNLRKNQLLRSYKGDKAETFQNCL